MYSFPEIPFSTEAHRGAFLLSIYFMRLFFSLSNKVSAYITLSEKEWANLTHVFAGKKFYGWSELGQVSSSRPQRVDTIKLN